MMLESKIKIFENFVLLIGLIMCLSGGWMRRNEASHNRGTKLLWFGFALMLFGLFMNFGQGFMEGWLGGKPKP
jgi:hypothetical protein